MTHWYTLCIHPTCGGFDYYELHDMELPNPVSRGDFVEFRDAELEIFMVVHEIGGKSRIHVRTDEKL